MKPLQLRLTRFITRAAIGAIVVGLALPLPASAIGQLTSRKVTLSNSKPAQTAVSYTFNFSVASATAVQSVSAQVCDAPSGACVNTGGSLGFTAASATLGSQPTGLGCAAGWSNASTAFLFKITIASCATAPASPVTIVFNGVTNPSTTNSTYYLRISTFSDNAYTTTLDSGTVAASTATQITLTGTMDESLVFCVGTTITGQNCATIAGSNINFGTFLTTATSSGTSVMAASTNGSSGYAITINGSTMTCTLCAGTPTIPALTAAGGVSSSVGTSQFGTNVRSNTAPTVGSDVTGAGIAVGQGDYNLINKFKFITGDSVAGAAAASKANTFTNSYIVNVAGDQPAGTYTATMTYICTATY